MYTCCTCPYLHTHLLLLLMFVGCIFSSVVCKFNMIWYDMIVLLVFYAWHIHLLCDWKRLHQEYIIDLKASRNDRPVCSAVVPKGRFPLPEFTARVHGPSWRPENSSAFFWHPSTRVVETDLKAIIIVLHAVQRNINCHCCSEFVCPSPRILPVKRKDLKS